MEGDRGWDCYWGAGDSQAILLSFSFGRGVGVGVNVGVSEVGLVGGN